MARPDRSESGAPGRIRTSDTRFRKPLLYPLSYGGVDDEDSDCGRQRQRSFESDRCR